MHPRDANVLFAALDDRVFRSTDGGASWTQLAELDPPASYEVRMAAELLIDPVTPRWESLQSGLEPILETVVSVAIDPTDSRILYAADFRLGYDNCPVCHLEPQSIPRRARTEA